MIIYPAIDLKNGQCVRLKQGMMDSAIIYNDTPLNQAMIFQNMGAEYLHIVDLDGAFQGKSVNHDAVRDIVKNTNMNIQLGGGIRDLDNIKYWLDLGVSRVILGSLAVKQPNIAIEAAHQYPNQIIIGLDSRDGMVTSEGWAEASTTPLLDCAKIFAQSPIAGFIHTDIASDGMLQGVNLQQTQHLAENTNAPVIASGGVRNLADIQAIKDTGIIAGVITGKAIYEGHLDLKEAFSIF